MERTDKGLVRGDAQSMATSYKGIPYAAPPVGAMGYLLTPAFEQDNADGAAGNFGIVDQQAALRWAQNNIRAFGGNPDNIRPARQSAGASNTVVQLASPTPRGLFDRAILQSGAATRRCH